MNVRPPARDEWAAVLELMRAHDRAAWGDSDWTEADLREEWEQLDLARDACVVDLDRTLAGFVFVDVRGGRVIADGYVHPSLRGRGVGSALVEWVERRAAQQLAETDERVYVHYATLEDEAAPFFERGGYRAVRHQYRMVIDLDGVPDVVSPQGIEIRPYRDGEARAIHETVEEAWSVGGWEHRPRSFEEFSKGVFERPGHDPSLCFVAAANGEVVGVSLNEWRGNGEWGWIVTLGVRPAWRRRGIGEALLRRSLAEFGRRGVGRVALGVDAQSPTGATRLYERAGMRALYRVAIFEKELRGA